MLDGAVTELCITGWLAGLAIGFAVGWLALDVLPSLGQGGVRVRWGRPPLAWFRRPTAKRPALAIGAYPLGPFRLVVYAPPRHSLIIAPSGFGKSTTLMSALLTWTGGVMALDPKGEFYDITSGWRAAQGQTIIRWDVRSASEDAHYGLPIDAMYGSRDAAVERLAQLIISGDQKQAPFVMPWISIVRALLADAEWRGAPPWTTAMSIPSSQWEAHLRRIASVPNHPGRADALEGLGKQPAPEYFASIAGTADQVAPVLRAIAGLLDRGIGRPIPPLERTSLYVVLPTNPLPGELLALRWIFSGMASYVERGSGIPRPGAVWIIDEAGALKPEGLDNWVRFMRGKGVSVMISTQSMSDLDAAYGKDNAAAIVGAMNGFHFLMGWRGLSDETIQRLASLIASHAWIRRGSGERREDRPASLEDARRVLAKIRHGVMMAESGRDTPMPMYPAPYFTIRFLRARAATGRYAPPGEPAQAASKGAGEPAQATRNGGDAVRKKPFAPVIDRGPAVHGMPAGGDSAVLSFEEMLAQINGVEGRKARAPSDPRTEMDWLIEDLASSWERTLADFDRSDLRYPWKLPWDDDQGRSDEEERWDDEDDFWDDEDEDEDEPQTGGAAQRGERVLAGRGDAARHAADGQGSLAQQVLAILDQREGAS